MKTTTMTMATTTNTTSYGLHTPHIFPFAKSTRSVFQVHRAHEAHFIPIKYISTQTHNTRVWEGLSAECRFRCCCCACWTFLLCVSSSGYSLYFPKIHSVGNIAKASILRSFVEPPHISLNTHTPHFSSIILANVDFGTYIDVDTRENATNHSIERIAVVYTVALPKLDSVSYIWVCVCIWIRTHSAGGRGVFQIELWVASGL